VDLYRLQRQNEALSLELKVTEPVMQRSLNRKRQP